MDGDDVQPAEEPREMNSHEGALEGSRDSLPGMSSPPRRPGLAAADTASYSSPETALVQFRPSSHEAVSCLDLRGPNGAPPCCFVRRIYCRINGVRVRELNFHHVPLPINICNDVQEVEIEDITGAMHRLALNEQHGLDLPVAMNLAKAEFSHMHTAPLLRTFHIHPLSMRRVFYMPRAPSPLEICLMSCDAGFLSEAWYQLEEENNFLVCLQAVHNALRAGNRKERIVWSKEEEKFLKNMLIDVFTFHDGLHGEWWSSDACRGPGIIGGAALIPKHIAAECAKHVCGKYDVAKCVASPLLECLTGIDGAVTNKHTMWMRHRECIKHDAYWYSKTRVIAFATLLDVSTLPLELIRTILLYLDEDIWGSRYFAFLANRGWGILRFLGTPINKFVYERFAHTNGTIMYEGPCSLNGRSIESDRLGCTVSIATVHPDLQNKGAQVHVHVPQSELAIFGIPISSLEASAYPRVSLSARGERDLSSNELGWLANLFEQLGDARLQEPEDHKAIAQLKIFAKDGGFFLSVEPRVPPKYLFPLVQVIDGDRTLEVEWKSLGVMLRNVNAKQARIKVLDCRGVVHWRSRRGKMGPVRFRVDLGHLPSRWWLLERTRWEIELLEVTRCGNQLSLKSIWAPTRGAVTKKSDQFSKYTHIYEEVPEESNLAGQLLHLDECCKVIVHVWEELKERREVGWGVRWDVIDQPEPLFRFGFLQFSEVPGFNSVLADIKHVLRMYDAAYLDHWRSGGTGTPAYVAAELFPQDGKRRDWAVLVEEQLRHWDSKFASILRVQENHRRVLGNDTLVYRRTRHALLCFAGASEKVPQLSPELYFHIGSFVHPDLIGSRCFLVRAGLFHMALVKFHFEASITACEMHVVDATRAHDANWRELSFVSSVSSTRDGENGELWFDLDNLEMLVAIDEVNGGVRVEIPCNSASRKLLPRMSGAGRGGDVPRRRRVKSLFGAPVGPSEQDAIESAMVDFVRSGKLRYVPVSAKELETDSLAFEDFMKLLRRQGRFRSTVGLSMDLQKVPRDPYSYRAQRSGRIGSASIHCPPSQGGCAASVRQGGFGSTTSKMQESFGASQRHDDSFKQGAFGTARRGDDSRNQGAFGALQRDTGSFKQGAFGAARPGDDSRNQGAFGALQRDTGSFKQGAFGTARRGDDSSNQGAFRAFGACGAFEASQRDGESFKKGSFGVRDEESKDFRAEDGGQQGAGANKSSFPSQDQGDEKGSSE